MTLHQLRSNLATAKAALRELGPELQTILNEHNRTIFPIPGEPCAVYMSDGLTFEEVA